MTEIELVLRNHQVVGLDTSPFIYHLEGSSPYAQCSSSLFDDLARGSFRGVTSVITLMEISVKPLQMARPDIADEYEVLLVNFPNLSILDLDRGTVRKAAELRAIHRIRAADALQIAACLRAGATAFVTNDRALKRVTELDVVLLEDFFQS
ncbi:MAG: type II toxin-antitoxin system VapC family toxin [Dehalococcoidia bacterium]|nr:type II toxin-antitoxin system VapC family toxin [Dehalococcoidia bacterium]